MIVEHGFFVSGSMIGWPLKSEEVGEGQWHLGRCKGQTNGEPARDPTSI